MFRKMYSNVFKNVENKSNVGAGMRYRELLAVDGIGQTVSSI